MPHRMKQRRPLVGGLIIPPSNLVLRSRTNYVPPASMMLKGGRIFAPSFTLKRGGGGNGTRNPFSTTTKLGSQLSRGYY